MQTAPDDAPVPTATVRQRLGDVTFAAAPTVAFLVVNALGETTAAAVAAAAVVALGAFAWRLYRREPLRKAAPGVLIVAVCASAAAVTGQARGFFLVPTLVPFVVIVVCLATIAVGRPLTGIVLNRIAGGPPSWHQLRSLRRVYTASTAVCVAVNVVNAVVQVVFYRADNPVVLGIAHIATGPVFGVIVAVTLLLARREINTLAH